MTENKRDLIDESKKLGIIDVRFSGNGNVVEATKNIFDSIKRLDSDNDIINKFINS